MKSHAAYLTVVFLAVIAGAVYGQPDPSLNQPGSPAEERAASRPAFPYVAQITGNNVYIRSGPGTENYYCGRLNTGDKVVVVNYKPLWSCIVPPAGCFSWISKQYVQVDRNNPTIGIVTGDKVRVWAGADHIQPMHSTRMQVELNKGERVMLLGEQRDGYYKVAPPDGAYLWVSTRYTKDLAPAGEVPLTVLPDVGPRPAVVPAGTEGEDSVVVVPTNLGLEARKLNEYYDLEKQIEAERDKPIAEQDYTQIKDALEKIATDKAAGKASRYADFALRQLERCEMVIKADKTIRLQDDRLDEVRSRIAKARKARMAEVLASDLGKYAVVGRFQISKIYGPEKELKHYRIIDDTGKIICYALPVGSAANADMSSLLGRKVGLVGTIEPHQPTGLARVKFYDIAEISR